jgi:hypothetical protein
MAQFLRTSLLPDGHLDTKKPYVFKLRAFDRELPILTGTAVFSDGTVNRLWVDRDGEFLVERCFAAPGTYGCRITIGASGLATVSKSFSLSLMAGRVSTSLARSGTARALGENATSR